MTPSKRRPTREEWDTDRALHEQEMRADDLLSPAQLEKLRDLAESLGVPREFVQPTPSAGTGEASVTITSDGPRVLVWARLASPAGTIGDAQWPVSPGETWQGIPFDVLRRHAGETVTFAALRAGAGLGSQG